MSDLLNELASLIKNTKYSDFSEPVVEKCKRHILDTLGAALAGSTSDIYQKVLSANEPCMSEGCSVLWGQSLLTGPNLAAFLNGVAAHMYELDDTGGCDHSGAVVVPAVLAVLPVCKQPVSGEKFITAVMIGYEVGRRILESLGGYAAHNNKGWHSTATCGVFGAAAAVAFIMDCTEAEIASALGIASSFSSGNWAFIHDGSHTKKLHAGHAAQHGVMSSLLAKAQLQGPSHIFEPVWGGFFGTHGNGQENPEQLVKDWGAPWKIERCSIKPYASCRGVHSSLDALQSILNTHGFSRTDIEVIEIRLSRFLHGMCGNVELESLAGTQMSLPYALAALVHYGKADLSVYEESKRLDPLIQAALQSIHLFIDDDFPSDGEPLVTVKTKDGRVESCMITEILGSPKNPLSDDKLLEKFNDLSQLCLPPEQVSRLMDVCLSLDEVEDCLSVVQSLAKA